MISRFPYFGQSLNFEWDNIESESKEITLRKTCKDSKDYIAKTGKDEKFVEEGAG